VNLIAWYRKYISISHTLNECIEGEAIDRMNSLLRERESLLRLLPGIISNGLNPKDRATFFNLADIIRDLEDYGKYLLKEKTRDIVHRLSRLKCCRRYGNFRKKECAIPRFIDAKC